jgi:hypothetical protein
MCNVAGALSPVALTVLVFLLAICGRHRVAIERLAGVADSSADVLHYYVVVCGQRAYNYRTMFLAAHGYGVFLRADQTQ